MYLQHMLRPFRLLRQDVYNLRSRYVSDWTVFNQLIIASAVYVFFTNLLPGITFANDLYELTGKSWGTIEVVFSTGLCGVIFSLYVFIQNHSVAYVFRRNDGGRSGSFMFHCQADIYKSDAGSRFSRLPSLE